MSATAKTGHASGTDILPGRLPYEFQERIRSLGNPSLGDLVRDPLSLLSGEERTELDALAERLGGHPQLTDISIGSAVRYMDFSECEFSDEANFQNLLLINASFKSATFRAFASFRNATFAGTSDFENASFRSRCRFDQVTFDNTASISRMRDFTKFQYLDGSKFSASAYFSGSSFSPLIAAGKPRYGGVGFRKATFSGVSDFEHTSWSVAANFNDATFEDGVSFRSSKFSESATFQRVAFNRSAGFSSSAFGREVNFSDASFRSTTCFRRASFSQPPMFFETELHEDTDFSDIDWQNSEHYYLQPWWITNLPLMPRMRSESVAEIVVGAIQAWDRLALIMSKLEKFPERHVFYRLRMRAQRMRDGFGILSLANWFFELLCDYGWSVGRAFIWWVFHFLFMGMLIFRWVNPEAEDWRQALMDSLLVGFANAHAFLGLTAEGGPLHEARQRLTALLLDSELLHFVGVTQAVVGPILLFLLILTLRNRFRVR